MRVTEGTNYDTIRDSIQRSRSRMENLQQQSATLKKLNAPSDDPVGSAKVLEVRTDRMNNDQFQMNAKLAETFLNNSDHALEELSNLLVRAKEIAVGQSSGASANDDTRLAVAEEVSQLYQQAVATANRRIGDRYIFGGYKTNKPPLDSEGRYTGDNGHMMSEIAKGIFLSMNVPGIEIFNTNPQASEDARSDIYKNQNQGEKQQNRTLAGNGESNLEKSEAENVNLFQELQNLRIALLAGDTSGIQNTLERFDQMHAKVVSERAKIGARVAGLQTTTQSLERHTITNAQLTSQLEDADMAQVVSDLAREETIFRSSLQSSHKLIQPTLLDFLK